MLTNSIKNKFLLALICCLLLGMLPAGATVKPVLKFDVQGVSGDMRSNVQSRLTIESKELVTSLSPGGVAAFSHQSIPAVRSALEPYGYYSARVSSSVERKGRDWVIVYRIQQGLPVKVTSVDIRVTGAGKDNKKILGAVKRFPLKSGDIFNSSSYTSARDRLFDIVNNQGYIKAVIDNSKVLVDTKSRTAIIRLLIDTHERYYFGKMNFSENAYDPAFMERFDVFNNTEHFSSDKLLQYQQDMNTSRYFKQVVVIPDLSGKNGIYVPIHVSAVPVNYRRYDFGLGFGTFTGPRVTAGLHFPRITNTGHSLDAQMKLSSVLTGFGLKYNIPGKNPLTQQWNLGANSQKFVPVNGESNSRTLTAGYTHKLRHWTLAANVNFLWERFTVDDTPNRNSQLLYPSGTISYLKVDDMIRPKFGRSFSVSLQGASKNVLSTTSFLQTEVKGKLFVTPLSFAHVILRGDLGYTVVNDLYELPLSMRFFAGGQNSIRGFPDQGIGPGKYLGIASIEYRNHLIYDFSAAIFYDVGTATNHFGTPLDRGAGVGLVYESPVGPIRLYVAKAVSKPQQPRSIEFSMGPEF